MGSMGFMENINIERTILINVMGEIVGSIKGISQAASTLNTPIISGNVSLYNETNGKGILPTPVIGMVGVIDEVENCLEMNAQDDNTLIVLGQSENLIEGWIGCSVYQEITDNKIDKFNISCKVIYLYRFIICGF